MRNRRANRKNNWIYIEPLLYLSFVCVFSIGFSSWIIGKDDKNECNVNVSVGDIVSADYKNSIFYVKNSEYFAGSYALDGHQILTNNQIGLKIKFNPKMIENNLNDNMNCYFGIQYTARTSLGIKLFNSLSSLRFSPRYEANYANYLLQSEDCVYEEKNSDNGMTTYKFGGNIILKSNEFLSMQNIYNYFGDTWIVADLYFSFEIMDNDGASDILKKIDLKIVTSLEGQNI